MECFIAQLFLGSSAHVSTKHKLKSQQQYSAPASDEDQHIIFLILWAFCLVLGQNSQKFLLLQFVSTHRFCAWGPLSSVTMWKQEAKLLFFLTSKGEYIFSSLYSTSHNVTQPHILLLSTHPGAVGSCVLSPQASEGFLSSPTISLQQMLTRTVISTKM